jgi:predicted ABC-type ATPase
VLAGPNGSGKSTYVSRILQPVTHLPFVNADVIAAECWPESQAAHAYEASRLAAERRAQLLATDASFITETVFSHPSKLELISDAAARGYLVHLHVMLVPVEVTVARVAERVHDGGHDVPEEKIRQRYERLWHLVAVARRLADRAVFMDNSAARTPFRPVAEYQHGLLIGEAAWPAWTPPALTA